MYTSKTLSTKIAFQVLTANFVEKTATYNITEQSDASKHKLIASFTVDVESTEDKVKAVYHADLTDLEKNLLEQEYTAKYIRDDFFECTREILQNMKCYIDLAESKMFNDQHENELTIFCADLLELNDKVNKISYDLI